MNTIYENSTRYRLQTYADGRQIIKASVRVDATDRRPTYYYRNIDIQVTTKRGRELIEKFHAA